MTLLSLCKCSPFTLQKDPFWCAKGPLLVCKRSPFGGQNESFWNAKGVLLKNNRRRVCQKSKQHAPKGQKHIAQGNALR